ncbi:MAG TPA: DUF6531 domain-containing protein, partial [Spirochaetia bacterium]|nr:DUF6531 domain-containing protein [Spirochaetia bacterium]
MTDAIDESEEISEQGDTEENEEKSAQDSQKSNDKITGDPVRIASGLLTTRETDLCFSFGGLQVEITRIYQSDWDRAHGFGSGWTFNYETRIIRGVKLNAEKIAQEMDELFMQAPHGEILHRKEEARDEAQLAAFNKSRNIYALNATDPDHFQHTGNGTLTLIDEEGVPHLYTIEEEPEYGKPNPYPGGSRCITTLPSKDSLQILPDGRCLFLKGDGRRYVYNAYGMLSSVADRNGNKLDFLYSGGKL